MKIKNKIIGVALIILSPSLGAYIYEVFNISSTKNAGYFFSCVLVGLLGMFEGLRRLTHDTHR